MYNYIINEMIMFFQRDLKRINHALKVFGYAEAIMSKENLNDKQQFNLRISSILHDIGIKDALNKYGSSIGKYQEIEGPQRAKKILLKYKIEKNSLDRILFLIGNHHSYGMIDNIDFQILIEADFIVNSFEDNLNNESILSVYNKYFKTNTGKTMLKNMYEI
ncbi:MAG: HD domain-containing protein [Clostridiales bacterium]